MTLIKIALVLVFLIIMAFALSKAGAFDPGLEPPEEVILITPER